MYVDAIGDTGIVVYPWRDSAVIVLLKPDENSDPLGVNATIWRDELVNSDVHGKEDLTNFTIFRIFVRLYFYFNYYTNVNKWTFLFVFIINRNTCLVIFKTSNKDFCGLNK